VNNRAGLIDIIDQDKSFMCTCCVFCHLHFSCYRVS